MTYIDYLNRFNLWLESNALDAVSMTMYYRLLHIFNRAGWPETVQVDNLRMESMLGGVAKTTVIRAREKLVEAGFIQFYRGKKGVPNRYRLVEKEFSYATKNATKTTTTSATEYDPQNATHIKNKTEKKTKTNNTAPWKGAVVPVSDCSSKSYDIAEVEKKSHLRLPKNL